MELQKELHQHESDFKRRIKEFRLMDDEFMTLVFDGNVKGTELLLNIILERDDMVVTEAVGQMEFENAGGRSVRLDIHAKDNTGKDCYIYILREDQDVNAKRARFYSAMLDKKIFKLGQNIEELADSYVILITERDVFGDGFPLYHVVWKCTSTGEIWEDGSHIIYVNGAYSSGEDAIGKLMHDFKCISADEMYYGILADRVRYFKETEEGYENILKLMEELAQGKST